MGDFITITLAKFTQNEQINSELQVKFPFFPTVITLCSFSQREVWLLVPNLIILLFVNWKVLFEEYRH